MQTPTVKPDLEVGNKHNEAQYPCTQYSSHSMLNFVNHNDKSDLGQGKKEAETDLSALKCKLSCLGQKAQQLEQFFRSESLWSLGQNERQQQAKSSLNAVLNEVISTSVSILSQCQILSNPQKPPKEEEEEKVEITEMKEEEEKKVEIIEMKEEEEEKVEIIEMKEDDILAEHVHFCKICGKGFRRDGNVRIHMRSHGNQYKTQEALKTNRPKPTKSQFACPVEDCRRNRGHPNFRPLKSMVCLRNHYRRTHCTKMYACNKCGKEFSFVTDLKTHGNKCGNSSWLCSCNTTFSAKNKLFRHIAMFTRGHKPVLLSHTSSDLAASLKPTSNGESLDCCAQDADDLAPEGLSTLVEGPVGCGSDEYLSMFDTECMGQKNEFAFLNEHGEENELYGSPFWPDADLLWP